MSQYEAVPEELLSLRQWMCWRHEDGTKIPYQPNGLRAKSNDRSTWSDFDACRESLNPCDGVAFVISADDEFCGVDLDDCIVNGEMAEWASEIVERFRGVAYGEISPSGEGVKLTTRAAKPAGSRCSNTEGVECYDNRRFWTVTGECLGDGFREIGDGQAAVEWLIEKHLPKTTKPAASPVVQHIGGGRLELLSRAMKYAANVPGTVKGNLRNAAFKLSGHLHAFTGDGGEKLTDDDVLGMLQEWNLKNNPMLELRELQEASVNGRKNGTPPEDKLPEEPAQQYPEVDLSMLLGEERTEDFDDEEFAESCVPSEGLIRDVYEYYSLIAQRRSSVMGLAVAISLCETIFGRRIASHTDLRTNDYNVIICPTNGGKEACEKTIDKILEAAKIDHGCMIPPDVQSGNGLMKAVAESRCCIWVADEFGKVLAAVLDKKQSDPHKREIGTHLLKLYGKADSTYAGAAHASGTRNKIIQPHLCVLGMTTGSTFFESVDSSNVSDGLFGRIAFWNVQNRPRRRRMKKVDVPEELSSKVRAWLNWNPIGNLGAEYPEPAVIQMVPDAFHRWEQHMLAIDDRMDEEQESRGAIWGRVAARSMKLAMVHRAAKESADPSLIEWDFVQIEMEDIEWGIRLSNWLARLACDLISQNFVDSAANRVRDLLLKAVSNHEEVSKRDLERACRSIPGSEWMAAAVQLESEGRIEIAKRPTRGRPSIVFRSLTPS